jgi:hypothetical protein
LQPIADELKADARALDLIAKAEPAKERFRAGPAREAKGYVLPPAPEWALGARPELPKDGEEGRPLLVRIDEKAVEAQLKEFGDVGTDLLAARRKAFGQ